MDGTKISKAYEALKNGANIITDTKMAWSGIHKTTLSRLGGQAKALRLDEALLDSVYAVLQDWKQRVETEDPVTALAQLIEARRASVSACATVCAASGPMRRT